MIEPKEGMYSEAELATIAETLGLPRLPDEIEATLCNAAATYLFLADISGELPHIAPLTPDQRSRKRALKKLQNYTEKLKAALEDQSAYWPVDGAQLFDLLKSSPMQNFQELLNQIIEVTKHDLALSTSKGRPKLEARSRFLKDLAQIYKQVTEKTPSVSVSRVTGAYEGQFLDFAKAAINPINRHAVTGLGQAIRDLKEQVDNSPTR